MGGAEKKIMAVKFKNGSSIETLESDGEPVRSKSRTYVYFLKTHPSKFVELTTGRKLPIWQRIYLDYIYGTIARIKARFIVSKIK